MKKIIHLDLFSGIGGFALAIDNVFGRENVNHIFCDNDVWCQEIIKKHWPGSPIFEDIRTLAHPESAGENGGIKFGSAGLGEDDIASADTESGKSGKQAERKRRKDFGGSRLILTAGVPCQPASQAGRRRGKADDRWLWPETFEVIRLKKPEWVVLENVRGLITLERGVVFQELLSALESIGYEYESFIIPAVAVNAPHRRDRVWIVAHHRSTGLQEKRAEQQTARSGREDSDAQNPIGKRRSGRSEDSRQVLERRSAKVEIERPNRESWNENWLEVAARLCGVDDGLPPKLDRNPRLKMLGNSIVPQVAEEIFKALTSILEKTRGF